MNTEMQAVRGYTSNMLVDTLINKKTRSSLINVAPQAYIGKEDPTSISNAAYELNSISKKLDQTGNTKAQAGLRHVIKHYATNASGFEDFMQSVNNQSKSDYAKVFATIDKMADKGLNVDKWMDTFSSISDVKSQKQFLTAANQILQDTKSDNASKKETLNKLMKSIDTIQNGSDQGKDEKIQGLLDAATKSKSVSEMKTAIDQYNKANSSK